MGVFDRQSVASRNVAAAFMSDLGPGMHPRVSIRGGQFALVDGGGNRYGANVMLKNTPTGQKLVLLAVIIGSNPKKSRMYFDGPYDPDNPGPPTCFSDNGIAPSRNASIPQARTCAECEFQKWGSDISQLSGKKIKACDEKKKLGILVVGDQAAHVYELQIPPATLKAMAIYAQKVAGFQLPGVNRKADLCDVVTEISFVSGQTGVLEFAPHCLIDATYVENTGAIQVARNPAGEPILAHDGGESTAAMIDDIWQSDELDQVLGLKDEPFMPPAGFLAPGMQPGGYLEHQPHGGALQRGQAGTVGAAAVAAALAPAAHPAPAPTPYSPPVGAAGAQPVQAFTAPPIQPAQGGPETPTGTPVRTRSNRRAVPAPATPAAPAVLPAAAAGAPPGDGLDVPEFLQRSRKAATAAAAPAGGSNFGMAEAAPPPSSIQAALNTVFSLNTTKRA